MNVQSEVHTLTDIEAVLDSMIFNQIKDVYDALVSDFNVAIIGSLLLFYVAMHGWLMWIGKARMTGSHLFDVALRLAVISALAVNANDLGWWLIEQIHQIPDHLVNIVVNGQPGERLQGNMSYLDKMISTSYDAASIVASYAKANFDWLALIFAAFVLGLGVLTAVIGAGLFFVAKFFNAVLLSISAIFILFLLFDQTHGFFVKWVNYIFNTILMSLLVAVGIRISYGLVLGVAASLPDTAGDSNTVISFLSIPVVFGLTTYYLKKIPTMASSLSGGYALGFANTDSLGYKFARAVGFSSLATGKLAGRAVGKAANDLGNKATARFQPRY